MVCGSHGVSSIVSRPIFASLGLEGYRSQDLEYCKKWFSKTFLFQRLLFVVFSGKKQQKQVEKCHRFEKINLEVMAIAKDQTIEEKGSS